MTWKELITCCYFKGKHIHKACQFIYLLLGVKNRRSVYFLFSAALNFLERRW